jgi:hypothetical protein
MNIFFWNPRRIGWRVALGFGVLVMLMLVALAQAIFQIHQITGVTQRFVTGDMQRLLRVQALSLQTEGVGNALIRLIMRRARAVLWSTPMWTSAIGALTVSSSRWPMT